MPHISIPKIRSKALLTQDLEGLPKSKSLGVKGHYPLVRLGSLLSHSDGVFCIGIPVRVKEMKDEISCYFPLAALVATFCMRRANKSRDELFFHVRTLSQMVNNKSLFEHFSPETKSSKACLCRKLAIILAHA